MTLAPGAGGASVYLGGSLGFDWSLADFFFPAKLKSSIFGGSALFSVGLGVGPVQPIWAGPQRATVSPVRIQPRAPGPIIDDLEVDEREPVVPKIVFSIPDIDYQPKRTVFEKADAAEVLERTIGIPGLPLPVAVPTLPVETNAEATVAIDWGNVLGGAIKGAAGWDPFGAGAAVEQFWPGPQNIPQPQPTPPKVIVDTRTGAVTTCARRRRRKMLTESDFNTLLRISTLPNNQNVRIALAKAIGRR